ncbi:MAG: right-handed parallel beta-helix repeat-containing protein, partial [Candidatus Cloacimonetes bacterium]|nr:right-handed parallel beta-helix repeat-containing protein [Candidatus Cloacimonadota bacterium]
LFTNAFAEKVQPSIFNGETEDLNGNSIVDHIILQITEDINDTTGIINWGAINVDFTIMDGATIMVPLSVSTGDVEFDEIIRLEIDEAYNIPCDKNDLELNYEYNSGYYIYTMDGQWVQETIGHVLIYDGVAPSLTDYSIISNHPLSPKLAVVGDSVTVEFTSNENLAGGLVAPTVTFFPNAKVGPVVVTATKIGGDASHWSATHEVTSTDPDERIEFKIQFKDVNGNTGTPVEDDTGTDGSYVILKSYLPATTYVDSSYDENTLPPGTGHIYLWDSFKTIQDGVDGVADPGTVNVLAGTYDEQITIDKALILAGEQSKGLLATIQPTAIPAAGECDVHILADNVTVKDLIFHFEGIDGDRPGLHAGGLVIGQLGETDAENCTITGNIFYTAAVAVQTGLNRDIDGLAITNNTFHLDSDGDGDFDAWDICGIYINPNSGTGTINISGNTIDGHIGYGIALEADDVTVSGNTITNTVGSGHKGGIRYIDWYGNNHTGANITGNTVQNMPKGIWVRSGQGSGSFAGTIQSNTITNNDIGVWLDTGVTTNLLINYNSITGNTTGLQNLTTTVVNAENNWWGSASGPDHADNTYTNLAGDPHGDAVTDYVDYVPWHDTDMTHTSFAPIDKDDGLKAITYYSSIQTAIDDASAGATITCQAGTFDEQFNIEVSNLILKGVSNTTTIIQPSAAPAVGFSDVAIGLFGGSNVDYVIIKDILFDFNGADGLRHGQGIVVSDLNGPAVENVVIEYCNIYCGLELATPEPKCGIQSGKNADLDGLIIRYNDFYGADGTYGSYGVYINPNSGTDAIVVTNNNFYGKQYAGVSVESNNVDVFYNTINPALGGTYGIRVIDFVGGVNYNDIAIGWNDIDNVTYGVSVGMSTSNGSTLAADIGYNTINNCDVGIRVREDADLSVNGEVHYNDLSGNTSFGIKVESTSNVNAEDNWWGSCSGPDHADNTFINPAGDPHGDAATNYVDYVPWFDDSMTGDTFAPVDLISLIKNGTTEYFSSIHTAIDEANPGDEIYCYAGTFTEDVSIPAITTGLEIRPNGTAKAYDDVTIKGVATNPSASYPLATPNIEILANSTKIHDFTIESPDVDDDCYSSGMVINGTGIEIYNNTFKSVSSSTTAPTSPYSDHCVVIQTYRDNVLGYNSDISGLNIHDNVFNSTGAYTTYQGAYVNHTLIGIGVVYVQDNDFSGRIFHGIFTERSNTTIDGNNVITDQTTAEYGRGIYVFDWGEDGSGNNPRFQENVAITENTVKGSGVKVSGNGFGYGIRIGKHGVTAQDLNNITVQYNTVQINDVGIQVRSDASAVVVNYNHITGNTTYGVSNVATVGTLDATKNWWGDATGATHSSNPHADKGYGDGDDVNDGVDFIPWYATSTVTPTTEYVETGRQAIKLVTTLAFADAIQPAIDAAAGEYYYVSVYDEGSTYTEDLTIDKRLYLWGEGTGKATIVTITGTHSITSDNVTVDNFIIDPNGGIGFTVNSSASTIDNTTFQNCIFDLTTGHPIGILLGGYTTPTNTVSNVIIDNNTFNGPIDKIANPWKIGGYYGTPVSCAIDGVDFTNNTVDKCSTPINLQDANINDILVNKNTFTNTDGVLYVWAGASSNPTGVLSNFVFTNNDINGTNTYGVGIDGAAVQGPNYTDANFGTGNMINYNSFDGILGDYGFGAVSILANVTNYILDAEDNWWGSRSGPIHSGNTYTTPPPPKNGGRCTVSDNVDYVRWYDSGIQDPADPYDPGFNPSGNLFAPVERIPDKTIGYYYSSIQAAIDDASNNDEIICYAGTFTEDFAVPNTVTGLDIKPRYVDKGYDAVTIKGIATLEAIQFPNVDPNIDIWGANTNIHNFTIEAPDYVEGYYSSSVVIGAQDVTIADNVFIMNSVSSWDDVSQVIQTYATIDVSGLNISGNTFTHTVYKNGADYGYEAIYINSDAGTGTVTIIDNVLSGYIFRGITTERSYTTITGNSIITDLGILPDDWSAPGSWQGINVYNYAGDPQTDIYINGNTVKGSSSTEGFNQGLRIGKDGQTLTNVYVGAVYKGIAGGNTFNYNKYGILVKSASGVTINGNAIVDNTLYGVQNTDTGAKTILDAQNNWWGAADGPSFTFDYGLGTGSGDEVSTYVDYTPWYDTDMYGTTYYPTVTQYLMQLNPTSPYQNNYFDIIIAAADTFGTRNQDYGNLADFSSSHAALTVPEEQLLVDGFKEVTNGCISTEAFAASDHLTIYSWEYSTQGTYYSSLTDIVIQPEAAPAPPTNVVVSDVPNDNGGWIYLDYTMSVDDPFYSAPKAAGVSYYIVEKSVYAVPSTDTTWIYLVNIVPFDDGSGTNTRKVLLNAPASDSTYAYRMASVNNPSKDYNFGDDHISYEPILMGKDGSQSVWVDGGSAAAADNLPAYADFTVFLEGPYNVTNHNMDALNSFIPLASPYDGETVASLPAGTVDWLQIQLRTTATGATEKTANAFLLSDGSIVDVDGNYSLPFYYTTGIDYYIVISHRNHLDIMTATGNTFGDFDDQATVINLSVAGSVYGSGFKEVETDVYAMYAGDSNDNGQIQNDDKNDYWAVQVGSGGYLEADFNLNGQVQNDDKNDFWQYNVGYGSTVPGGAKNSGDNTYGEKSIGITFTFANGVLSGGYYEFDVMVAGSAEGTKLGDTQTYINYNTLGFGSSIYANGKVTLTKGTILQGDISGADLYTLTNVTDNTTSRISVTYGYNFSFMPSWANDLPTTPTQIMHVKIEIADPSQTAGLSFEQSLMENQQYYSDNTNKYSPVIAIDEDNTTLPVELSAFT